MTEKRLVNRFRLGCLIVLVGLTEAVIVTVVWTVIFGAGPPWTWSDKNSELAVWGWGILIAFGGPIFLILFLISIAVLWFFRERI